MADVWGIPEVKHWWLSDETQCPPIIRSIHAFMKDRLTSVEGQPRSEDQRNIKGIFSQLSVGESPKSSTHSSRETTTSSSVDKSPTFPGEGGVFQSLAIPAGDEDLDMASDNSMLDQTRESFYNMADEDVEVRKKLCAQGGQSHDSTI